MISRKEKTESEKKNLKRSKKTHHRSVSRVEGKDKGNKAGGKEGKNWENLFLNCN